MMQTVAALPPFMSVKDFCAATSLCRASVYKRIASGEIVVIRIGARTLVDTESGLAWIRSHARKEVVM